MRYIIFIICGMLTFGMYACNSKQNPATEEQDHDHGAEGEEEHAEIPSLTAAQIKSIGIEFGSIQHKQLTASLRANGVLKVPNQNKATVNTLYNGVVKSLLVQTGNTVKKGQVIATISNPQFIVTQEEYLALKPKITLAEQEVNRQKELNQGNAGALKNLQAASADLSALQARASALKEQLQLMGISTSNLTNGKLISVIAIHSPITGVVSKVTANVGSYLDVNTPVAEIVDNSQLHLDLFIYEKDLAKLKTGQLIHFTLTNAPGKEYDATIFSLGSTFEGESKAISVHAKVNGDKTGLIDGMGITALISLDKAVVPAVPSEAVVNYQNQDYIFIVTKAPADAKSEDNTKYFERIPVAKGTTDVGYTEITPLKEISDSALVVVKGAFFILAKQTNSGDHEH
ncbi:efflux RND transporter periplasmic adaptor subunit [Chitinophaga silvatica]|uniref:Efflux RND transporter periplasmic adaptor subunit n=1 Tax=Chitinophaga silvatica TaxID=2282649 RepID=A0A3E1YI81_9BACT|nr:efflux RND transporter periplasmic adaptor subunit [Chitinophaga silvatica]RFS26950.1 efflux RND transporter periplasmic adaptor subunit [Chitinophaga silvatica]